MGRGALGSVLALAVTLVLVPGTEGSNHNRGFKATLWAGGLGQRGELYRSRDTDCGPQDCTTGVSVGDGRRFPEEALRIGPEQRDVRVDAHLERKRPATKLRYWSEVDAEGKPVGDPSAIDHRLGGGRRTSNDWRVRFTSPPLTPEAFIDLRFHWRDDLGDRSYARFGFHLAE